MTITTATMVSLPSLTFTGNKMMETNQTPRSKTTSAGMQLMLMVMMAMTMESSSDDCDSSMTVYQNFPQFPVLEAIQIAKTTMVVIKVVSGSWKTPIAVIKNPEALNF